MSNLYIHHHLGLGDMIHMNGMVRRILKDNNHDNIYVFSKNCYYDMIDWMYRDNDSIHVIGINEKKRERKQVDKIIKNTLKDKSNQFLRVGHEFYAKTSSHDPDLSVDICDIRFYEQVGIPYSSRYTDCYWSRDLQEEERVYEKLTPKNSDYIFVHDDANRGHVITNEETRTQYPIVRNDITESIFHLGLTLERAKEVHVMESSIRCMMEFLEPGLIKNNVKLYLHDFRSGPIYNKEKDCWYGTRLPFKIISNPKTHNKTEKPLWEKLIRK